MWGVSPPAGATAHPQLHLHTPRRCPGPAGAAGAGTLPGEELLVLWVPEVPGSGSLVLCWEGLPWELVPLWALLLVVEALPHGPCEHTDH